LLEQIHTLPSVSYVTKIRNIDPDKKAQNYSKYYPVYGDQQVTEGDDGHGSHEGHH
jgi:hypothetical protein